MRRLLRSSRGRALAIQAVVLVAVLAIVATVVVTTRDNLVAQGIATGFGFLEHSTGWPINFSLIAVSPASPYWRMLLAGLLNTLLVGTLGIALATGVGLCVGLMRISGNLVLEIVGTTFVEVFRNVPLILQAFVWYAVLTRLPSPRGAISLFGAGFLSNRGLVLPAPEPAGAGVLLLAAGLALAVPAVRAAIAKRATPGAAVSAALALAAVVAAALLLSGGGPLVSIPALRGLRFAGGVTVKPEFTALLASIAGFGGAYVGEIVRGGFISVDRGRIEAARALGLTGWQAARLVRIPLAVRAILPALANQYVWLMKATTIGIAIGYPDYFMVVSTSINQSGQTIELIVLLMAGFLAVNYAIGTAMNVVNRRLALKGQER